MTPREKSTLLRLTEENNSETTTAQHSTPQCLPSKYSGQLGGGMKLNNSILLQMTLVPSIYSELQYEVTFCQVLYYTFY